MEVFWGEKYVGSISDKVFPAFYYCCNEWGFHIELYRDEKKVVLLPGLFGKQISIFKDQELEQGSLRRETAESKVLNAIKETLLSSGIQMNESIKQKDSEKTELLFSLNIFQMHDLYQPTLELYHSADKLESKKWIELIRKECQKAGINLLIHELDSNEESHTVKVNLLCPKTEEGSFWEHILQSLAHILSIGLICKLQYSFGLSPLSIFPLEFFLPISSQKNNDMKKLVEPTSSYLEEISSFSSDNIPEPISSAEAFFDYHLLLNEAANDVKIFGSLSISNTGSLPLKNPFVCFRVTPAGSINLTGQILPPNTAKVQGIQTVDGTKGWMFMSDNWLEVAYEKGEYWVSPIHEMLLAPGEFVKMSNLQMKINHAERDKNIKVEAFIFFREDELEITANNKISLMIKAEKE